MPPFLRCTVIRTGRKYSSAETDVWNRSMEVRWKDVHQFLVPYWLMNVCWGLVAKGWLSHSDMRAGSWDLRLQRASLSWCHGETNSEWANHTSFMPGPYSRDSDTASVYHSSLLNIFASGSTSYRTILNTKIPTNSHCSLATRPRQYWTKRIMLNKCVSVRWSLILFTVLKHAKSIYMCRV